MKTKECMLDQEKNEYRISIKQFLDNSNLDEITEEKNIKPLQYLAGTKCIKHTGEFRDDYFYGGLDKDNNSFCYGKDDECFMFKNNEECEKMGLQELLRLPPPKQLKGIDYSERNFYDKETLKEFQTSLGAKMEEDGDDLIVKCPDGQYLEGTFNPEDDSAIIGGIYRDCSDEKHPNYESCAPGPSHHLSELITNKGKRVYDSSKTDKESNFGNLEGKCIKMNIPEGRMGDCDPFDDHQPCYVGEREIATAAPGVSEKIQNTDLYNKFMGFNCHTRTLNTNTCKHNNNGILSDVISFKEPLEKDYMNIIDKHKILETSSDYDISFSTDEEKYMANNLHFYIEKYEEKYKDMNPNLYFNNLRYTLQMEEYYDMLNKQEVTKLVVYYKGIEEATLTDNTEGEIYTIKTGDLIEILIQKDNHIIFKILNPVTKLVEATHTSINPIEGEYGSTMNFYIATNNNTFLKDIKYKEQVPKTVLPYNPFIDVKQI